MEELREELGRTSDYSEEAAYLGVVAVDVTPQHDVHCPRKPQQLLAPGLRHPPSWG